MGGLVEPQILEKRDGTKPGLWTHGLDRGLDYGLDHGPKIDSILGM